VAARHWFRHRLRRWIALGAVLLGAGTILTIVSGAGRATAAISPGATTIVSLRNDGSQSTDFSNARGVISGNGRYVAFSTNAVLDNAPGETSVDGQNESSSGIGDTDVYVRDRVTGHTALVSRGVGDADGTPVVAPSNGISDHVSISADGRYVAFESTATDLDNTGGDQDDTEDAYLCDRDADGNGVFDDPGPFDVSCVALGRRDRDSAGLRRYLNENPSLSADGKTIAWDQEENFNSRQAPDYAGTIVAPVRISEGVPAPISTDDMLGFRGLDLPGMPPFREVNSPKLSGDGRHVAMLGVYQNAATTVNANAVLEVNMTTDPEAPSRVRFSSLVRLDVAADGAPLFADGCCFPTSITRDGGLVAFATPATNDAAPVAMVSGPGNAADAKPVARVVSLDNDGQPAPANGPALSADGRLVAYSTAAGNMHNGVDFIGENGPCNSSEGGFVAMQVPNQRTCADVVVRDLAVDAARVAAGQVPPPGELASPGLKRDCAPDLAPDQTCEGDSDSADPSISDAGSVAYDSFADDLVPSDTNRETDMFVRDFQPTVAGEPVDFGGVELGQDATRDAAVRHVGFGPVLVDQVEVLQDGADYTIRTDGCGSVTLTDPASVCGVSLRFAPTAAGERDATLRVHPRDRPPVDIPLRGQGASVVTTPPTTPPTSEPPTSAPPTSEPPTSEPPAPDGFAASPDPLDFGERLALSPSEPRTVTVRNAGTAPFTVNQVSLPTGTRLFGADYPIVADRCRTRTLAPGQTCAITLRFVPRGAGARNAVLQVTTTQQGAPGPAAHAIGLRGSSPAPTLLVNPGVVVNGRVTTLSGERFAPDRQLLLAFSDGGRLVVRTDATGSFAVPYLVLSHSQLGNRDLIATVPGTTLRVSANLLVVTGTLEPPDYGSRR
jgi:WD40-like Beta Propeller Repeat